MMRRSAYVAAIVAGLMTQGAAYTAAQDLPPPIEPEDLIVQSKIADGPNIYLLTQSGASAVTIMSADDLSYKANFPAGGALQFALSADGKTGYLGSVFQERMTYGPIEAVFQAFDVDTVKAKYEVIIPPEFALVTKARHMLQVDAAETFAFAQNATPATSVSVINLKDKSVASEIPIPGCWAIYLSPVDLKFSSLCGDGTIMTSVLNSDGTLKEKINSEVFFNPDEDPLFAHAERVDGDLVFISFSGKMYRVSDSDGPAKLVDSFDFAGGIEGDWGPGGYELMGYNAAHGVMFIGMHKDRKDGSHKERSQEVWAVDVKNKKVLYRSIAKGASHLAVSSGETPVLFTVNRTGGVVTRYEIDPEAKFAAKMTHEVKSTGGSFILAE